jgi:murein L,D-transpeptidase YcbB/YkuD
MRCCAGLLLALVSLLPPSPAAADVTPAMLAARLSAPVLADAATGDGERLALQRYYGERDWPTLWSGSDSARTRAHAVAAMLLGAAREGLSPEAYEATTIARLLATPDPGAAADLEVLLSRNILRYARDVRFGRLAGGPTFDVPSAERMLEPASLLDALVATPDVESFIA